MNDEDDKLDLGNEEVLEEEVACKPLHEDPRVEKYSLHQAEIEATA